MTPTLISLAIGTVSYLIIASFIFVYRIKNFIKLEEGRVFILDSDEENRKKLYWSINKAYAKLNTLRLKKEAGEKLSKDEVEAWNEGVEYISPYWISIGFVAFVKAAFFFIHIPAIIITPLFVYIHNKVEVKIKNRSSKICKKLEMTYEKKTKLVPLLSESSSYRKEPGKLMIETEDNDNED